MNDQLEARLYGEGPKRILALDGGGVRGALALEYLARIEGILAERAGTGDEFRLADYFDLIGGTSTGAIIAACLAKGDRVSEIQALYQSLAGRVFTRPWWRFGVLVPKYDSSRLARVLDQHLGDLELGSDELRTGLVVVVKRLDTASPWPLTNIPRGRYYGARVGSNAIPNSTYKLSNVVRASTAAPHYFDPERFAITEALQGVFVDGGVSTANNPALQLFLIATLEGFTLNWPTGKDDILLVSVGTGAAPDEVDISGLVGSRAAVTAAKSLVSIMADADALNQTVLQAISDSPTAWPIDREIGDLRNDQLAGRPLLSYLRYNVRLDAGWLEQQLGYAASPERVAALRAMDDPGSLEALATLGRYAAAAQVSPDHLPPAFDTRRQE